MKGPSTRLNKPGARPFRLSKEKALGTAGELSTSTPGRRCQEGAPNVSARGADEVNMGDEVAPRDISDAGTDPTCRQIEDHVPTGHASFRSWCAACEQGRGRAERHQAQCLDGGVKDPSLVVG